MAEIIWGVPLVDYAQFQIHASPEELGIKDLSDGYAIGYAYATWARLVGEGFADGVAQKPREVTGQYQESSEPTPEQAESEIKKLGATTVAPWTVNPPEKSAKDWENFDV